MFYVNCLFSFDKKKEVVDIFFKLDRSAVNCVIISFEITTVYTKLVERFALPVIDGFFFLARRHDVHMLVERFKRRYANVNK